MRTTSFVAPARANGVRDLVRIDRKLPAKVLKRVGQVRRLGARGFARTAFAIALGPAVYSLMQPAMDMRSRRLGRRARTHALEARLAVLRERVRRGPAPKNGPGLRQTFGANRGAFVQALEAALDMAELRSIPGVLSVDWEAYAITFAAPVEPLKPAGDASLASAIEQSLLAVHRAGYVLGQIGDDDVAIASDGTAVFVNLARALPLAGLSRDMSIYLRDLDSERCNKLFGTQLITARELRSGNLASPTKAPGDRAYASVVIRDDIRWGRIWNTDVATGRWNYFLKHHLPIPEGGTVLDLGSNNGFNPLQMLRRGAATATAVEYNESIVHDGEFLKRAFEWLDNRTYDLRYIHGSFADLPRWDLGRFDMVSAFCSLYYLGDREMREIARHIRTLTDVFVLQCNTDRLIYREEKDQYRRATVEFAVDMLEVAGFTDRQIIAPPGYSRPLVIGRAVESTFG